MTAPADGPVPATDFTRKAIHAELLVHVEAGAVTFVGRPRTRDDGTDHPLWRIVLLDGEATLYTDTEAAALCMGLTAGARAAGRAL